jgi:amino acid transporter
LLITALAILGLKIVARFESAIVVSEYVVILTVAAIAAVALLQGTSAARFSWQWFSWTGMGGMKGVTGGILIAYFMYSGWDAAIYVNEETTDRVNSPGKAALASVVMLALVYSVAVLAFQSVLPPGELQAHAGNALSAVGGRLLHTPWDSVMALVVLAGTLASLQAAVVSAARVGFAMARDRVMPGYFKRVRASGSNPWAATLTMSAINLILLALALGTSTIAAALTSAASSLGLISIVFYGITAAAALWQQRTVLTSSASNLILGGLLPLIGVAFSVWVFVESLLSGAVTGAVMIYGLGPIACGAAVALFLRRHKSVRFFDAPDGARATDVPRARTKY